MWCVCSRIPGIAYEGFTNVGKLGVSAAINFALNVSKNVKIIAEFSRVTRCKDFTKDHKRNYAPPGGRISEEDQNFTIKILISTCIKKRSHDMNSVFYESYLFSCHKYGEGIL